MIFYKLSLIQPLLSNTYNLNKYPELIHACFFKYILSRIIEYFFTPPLLNQFHLSPNSEILFPVNSFFFSEGNLGIFYSIPLIIFIFNDIFKFILNFFKMKIFSSSVLLFSLFIIHFVMLSFFMMTTLRYAYEFLLPLFLLFFISSDHVKFSFFKISLLFYQILFLFSFLL